MVEKIKGSIICPNCKESLWCCFEKSDIVKEAKKELLKEMMKDNDNNINISTESLREYLNKKLSNNKNSRKMAYLKNKKMRKLNLHNAINIIIGIGEYSEDEVKDVFNNVLKSIKAKKKGDFF